MSDHYVVHESLSERSHRPGPPPDADAGKRARQPVREKYDLEYYRKIGREDGSSPRERHGSEHYARIGRLGGERTKARYGVEHYARIGRLSGQARRQAKEREKN